KFEERCMRQPWPSVETSISRARWVIRPWLYLATSTRGPEQGSKVKPLPWADPRMLLKEPRWTMSKWFRSPIYGGLEGIYRIAYCSFAPWHRKSAGFGWSQAFGFYFIFSSP